MPSAASPRGAVLRLFGPEVCSALDDPEVTELYTVEGDRFLWLDSLTAGRRRSSIELPPDRAEMLLNTVASLQGVSLGPGQPVLSADLPDGLGRLQGFLAPISRQVFFVLRKPAGRVFSLAELAVTGFLPASAADLLGEAIRARETILVVGGTGTGKTTFLNSLLGELSRLCPSDRVGLLEDTPELRCSSADFFALRTSEGFDLARLVKEALRSSPSRLVVGEVRDQAALAMLDAWNTGHPGGLATLHANGCPEALLRLSTLVQRAGVPPQPELIAATVGILVHLAGTTRETRRVAEIARLTGFNPTSGLFQVHSLYERSLP